MQPYWHYHIATNNYRDYRPASQAVFSVVYTSVTTVNQYYFQCGKKIYRRGRIDAYTYPDYRSALQAVFSVIYVSHRYQSVWIQWILNSAVWDSRVGLAGVQDSVARAFS